jgi:FAD/FMN-containing dehydrogenase
VTLRPGDPGYDAARRVWNLDIDRHPAAIVYPESPAAVAQALYFARDRGLPLAVRSGGHSQAGHSVCDGGVVIDLGRLDRIRVDPGRRTVHTGAGVRTGALLAALGPAGLVTPTGGCPDVGIGGLTLGGGTGALMARFGATCDNLLSADVVTVSGEFVRASANQHPDLFWALRGGGGNFGIATGFELRAHRLDRVLSGRLLFPVHRAREAMLRYRDLARDAGDDLQTSGGIVSSETQPAFFIALCHCGEANAANHVIDRWRAALRPDTDDIAWNPYTADLELPAIAGDGTGAFLPDLSDAVVDILADAFAAAPPFCTAAWNDYHGAVTRVAVEATAFPLRRRGCDLFVHAGWRSAGSRDAALAWLRELADALRPFAAGVYVNSLGHEPMSRTADAYGPNFDRLRAIKGRYDPANVFRHNHNIPPP